MIIGIQNFKSIGEKISLELNPLTILVGPNGSGKSSILEAISIMAQSLLSDTINHTGNLVKFDSLKSIFHKGLTSEPLVLSLEATIDEYEKKILEATPGDYGIPLNAIKSIRYEYSLRFHSYDQYPEVYQSFYLNESLFIRLSTDINRRPQTRILEIGIKEVRKYSAQMTGKGFSFLNAEAFRFPKTPELNSTFEIIKSLITIISNNLKVSLLLSTRGRLAHYVVTDVEPNNVGPEGEYTVQILAKIFGSSEYDKIRKKIVHWAGIFGLEELRAGWHQGNLLSSDYFDSVLKHNINVSLAGFGSKQALTMLVELFWSKEGSIILIEEPEINLHPAAQVLLPTLFAEVIKERKKIILSTHSELIVLALNKPITEKMIDTSHINIYNIEKNETGTKLKKFEISEKGYVKELIPSFTQVETDLLNDFLDSVPKE